MYVLVCCATSVRCRPAKTHSYPPKLRKVWVNPEFRMSLVIRKSKLIHESISTSTWKLGNFDEKNPNGHALREHIIRMKIVLFVLCTLYFQSTKYNAQKVQWVSPQHNKMKFRLLQFRFDRRFGVHRASSEISPCVA